MTYSVVALSRGNRYMAAATASYSLAVGNAVPALAPGIAAVVTQAYTNTSFRHEALAAARRGLTAEQVLAELAELDQGFAKRQVGMVMANGSTAAHSGLDCSDWAGSIQDEGFVVLGNLLQGPAVVKAMAEQLRQPAGAIEDGAIEDGAIEDAGDFADRILAALQAGQEAGGDARGQQSAALLIGAHDAGDTFPPVLAIDLRVDDSPVPLTELNRLLNLWRRER